MELKRDFKTVLKLFGLACLAAFAIIVSCCIGYSRVETKISECMANGDSRALCEAIILRNRF